MNIPHPRRKFTSVAYSGDQSHHPPFLTNLESKESNLSARKLAARLRNPRSESEGSSIERRLSFQMESVTKWDMISPRMYKSIETIEEVVEDEPQSEMVTSYLRSELWKAQLRIQELETEKISSEQKIKCLMRKQEREKKEDESHPLIDYLQNKLAHERKKRRRVEAMNTKLLKKISESESLLKRKAREREAIEEVCEELMRRMETINTMANRFRDKTEEEKQMLQMAEVWREERVRMKLVDAKLALQEKYEEMNMIVSEFEKMLKGKREGIEEKAEGLMKMARSVNVSDQIRLQDLDSVSEDNSCNNMY